MTVSLQAVGDDDLDIYPIKMEDRLETHSWFPWSHRRWLNSEMRLRATPECRAHYQDLICISYDQAPVGTLPDDMDMLSKLIMVDPAHFRDLCRLTYGPLYKWRRCLCEMEDGALEVRLMHSVVVRNVLESLARREDNRARNDAANATKRRQRLRITVAGYHHELSQNDAAILWMDEWLVEQGCAKRTSLWIERAIHAWSDHSLSLHRRRGPG